MGDQDRLFPVVGEPVSVEEARVWLARRMMSRKRKKPHNMRPKGGRTTPKGRN